MKSGLLTFLLFFSVTSIADWIFYATGDDETLYWYESKKSILNKNELYIWEKQRFAENIFSLYTNFRWGIKDPLCGMKGYSMNIYKELGHFDSYKSIGTELLLFALCQKYNFDQIPIIVNERKDNSRFGSSFKVNLKIIFSLLKHIVKIFS